MSKDPFVQFEDGAWPRNQESMDRMKTLDRPPCALQEWVLELPLQQQCVLMLALRGPDGDPKHTVFKRLLRAYRGSVLLAAKYGRPLRMNEKADTFMTMTEFANFHQWKADVDEFVEDYADGSVLHHYTHFMHGAQIIAYKHSDPEYRDRWFYAYSEMVKRLHLNPETREQMDARLCDWNRKHWER